MRIRIALTLTTIFFALAMAAPFARAEDEEPKDIREEIKAQMEEILALMKSNQDALLKLSTGKRARPSAVDVDVPVPPESKQTPPPSSSGDTPPPAGTEGGSTSPNEQGPSRESNGSSSPGEDAARALEKALEGTAQSGQEAARKIGELLKQQRIPSEIEQLLKMIPT